jgi:hypothetical protein
MRKYPAHKAWVSYVAWPGEKEDASEESKGDVRRTAGKKIPGAGTMGVVPDPAG